MKLITEENFDVKCITETLEEGKQSNLYIEGLFMQGDKPNKNGRIYPSAILEKQMNSYNENFILKNRSLGELNHPSGPTINLDKVSHMIVEMKKDGSDFYGKAKILDTPMGNIARKLIEGGASLGVSTRGLGSVKPSGGVMVVQEDFVLNTIDIVAQPSAQGAWVNGIMENVEWIYEGSELKRMVLEEIKEDLDKANLTEEEILENFEKFLKTL
ncbi:MAG: primosomal protein [Hyphomicrobiales bacterium]|nr:MAG: primosomal protein [Hyphomicrobiales bacterium]